MTALKPLNRLMPPPCPLARPIQSLGRRFRDPAAPAALPPRRIALARLSAFVPPLLVTLALGDVFLKWFRPGGIGLVEVVLVTLICLTFVWIALSVSSALVGIGAMLVRRDPQTPVPAPVSADVPAMSVALLVPIYNEDPADVFGNAAAMLAALDAQDLRRKGGRHRYALFFLSDTRDEDIATAEWRAFSALRASLPDAAIWYRRRADNAGRKTGNLADWVEGWGGGHEAMLVLDADSLMSGEAIVSLTDTLAGDPSSGLVQSFPQIFAARTLFGRLQQFSAAIYGGVLARGMAAWSGNEGNYWGHNAILRTAAFATAAGLPPLRTLRSRAAMILSHDFVEAALLRRAGWAVRFHFTPGGGSYEEAPPTLIDYVLRDRRWCQGNLQHLFALGTAGLHPLSRFHLLQGAVSYLMSPAWFVLLIFWALLGNGEASLVRYFSADNPLFPVWPETSRISGLAVMVFMYAMLLAPKAMGAVSIGFGGVRLADLGGAGRFATSVLAEVVLSVIYAPVLMVQQMNAVLRTAIGYRETWTPQQRKGGRYPLRVLAKFHAVETATGLLLLAGMAAGLVSLWLLPIALSVAAAVPLSWLSGLDMRRWPMSRFCLCTPLVFAPPPVIRRAMAERAALRAVLAGPPADVAAERPMAMPAVAAGQPIAAE